MDSLLQDVFFETASKPLPKIVDKIWIYCIEEALCRNGGCRSEAAEQLGIKRTTLVMKMKKFGYGKFSKVGQCRKSVK